MSLTGPDRELFASQPLPMRVDVAANSVQQAAGAANGRKLKPAGKQFVLLPC